MQDTAWTVVLEQHDIFYGILQGFRKEVSHWVIYEGNEKIVRSAVITVWSNQTFVIYGSCDYSLPHSVTSFLQRSVLHAFFKIQQQLLLPFCNATNLLLKWGEMLQFPAQINHRLQLLK